MTFGAPHYPELGSVKQTKRDLPGAAVASVLLFAIIIAFCFAVPLSRRKEKNICSSLEGIGVEIESDDSSLKAKMASDMFDTKGK